MRKRKLTIHHGGDYKTFRDELVELKKDFVVKQTLRTVKIEVGNQGYLFSDSKMEVPEMQLQKKMKQQIQDCEIDFAPKMPEYTAKYYDFAESLRDIETLTGDYHEFENVMELDITSAYYQAAYNLKYISREFFEECKGLPKPWRLRLIGSIATAKDIFTYKAGRLKNHIVVKDKKGRKCWNDIVNYVDMCMNDVKDMCGHDFMFYWVDGIFMTTKWHDKMTLLGLANIIFKRCNFDFDITMIPKLEIVNVEGASQILVHHENGTMKPYFITKKSTKAYYLESDLME